MSKDPGAAYWMSGADFLKMLVLLAQEMCAFRMINSEAHSAWWLMFWFTAHPLYVSIGNMIVKCTKCTWDDLLLAVLLEVFQGGLWTYFASPSFSAFDAPPQSIIAFASLGALQLIITLHAYCYGAPADADERVRAGVSEVCAAIQVFIKLQVWNIQFGPMQPYSPWRFVVNYYFSIFNSWGVAFRTKDNALRPYDPKVQYENVPVIIRWFISHSGIGQLIFLVSFCWQAAMALILTPWTLAYSSHSLVFVVPPCRFPASYWADGEGFVVDMIPEGWPTVESNCSGTNQFGWDDWVVWSNRPFLVAAAPQDFQPTYKIGPYDWTNNVYNFVDRQLFEMFQSNWTQAGYIFDVSTNAGFNSYDFLLLLIVTIVFEVVSTAVDCMQDKD
jgi:hypothetical protein